MTVKTAIEQFRTAALKKGAFDSHTSRDHSLYHQMDEAFRFLMSQGDLAKEAFRSLLLDENEYVRLWASGALIYIHDSKAVEVLEELRLSQGLLGFSAGMTLDQYRAGTLRPPFGPA